MKRIVRKSLSLLLTLCMVFGLLAALGTPAGATEAWESYTELSTAGTTLNGGNYKVTANTSKTNLAISGDVTIYIASGVTLTCTGSAASEQTSGKAGINVPSGATLILEGAGTVKATGGKAYDGGNGNPGGNGSVTVHGVNTPSAYASITVGTGGGGGSGGAGAGAGIGGNGGSGMGTLIVKGSVTVTAAGGAGGSSGSAGSRGNGAEGFLVNANNVAYFAYAAGGGGGGKGGGGGAGAAIGSGGSTGSTGDGGYPGNTVSKTAMDTDWMSNNVARNGDAGNQGKSGAHKDNVSGSVYYVDENNINATDWKTTVSHTEQLASVVTFRDNITGLALSTPAAQEVLDNEAPTQPTIDPVKTGYTFNGWYQEQACTNTYNFSTTLAGGQEISVYAKFVPKTYELALNNQGGSDTPASVEATYDAVLPTVTPPTRADYTFNGYYSAVNGAGTKYIDGDGKGIVTAPWTTDVPAGSTATLYASWTDNRSIAVAAQTAVENNIPTRGTGSDTAYAVTATGYRDTTFAPEIVWDGGSAPTGVTTAFDNTGQAGSALTITTTDTTPAGSYTFNIKSNDVVISANCTFLVWEKLTDVDYSVKDGKITNTTTAMEYSLNGSNWIACAAGDTAVGFVAGDALTIRDENAPGRTRKVFETALSHAAAPTAPVVQTDELCPTSDSITISVARGVEYYISTNNSAPATWPTKWPTDSTAYHYAATDTDTHSFT
ncbi:MAG: InlB B-repeat-containing protein, partial [Syntrophomonadaceae bacterium]|nr:InlB B-repeat-containing protein [Syntrophomonadaceae bacterium]